MRTNVKILTFVVLTSITIFGCKKNTAPPFPFNYTAKMGGVRYWSGVTIRILIDTSGGTYTVQIDSTYINDTFAITIINDKTIEAPDLLNILNPNDLYFEWDSTNTLAFNSYGVQYPGNPNGYTLIYDYTTNTINYYGFTEDITGNISLTLHSP